MMFDFGIRHAHRNVPAGWRIYLRAYRYPLDTRYGEFDFSYALRALKRNAKRLRALRAVGAA